MEDSLAEALKVAVALVIIGMVLSYEIVAAGPAKEMANASINFGTQIVTTRFETDVADLNGYRKSLPVASIYVFIDKYANSIAEVKSLSELSFDSNGIFFPPSQDMDSITTNDVSAEEIFSTVINNKQVPFSRDLEKIIGKKVYVQIVKNNLLQTYIIYVSDKTVTV